MELSSSFSFVAVLHLVRPSIGDAGGLWNTTPGPYTDPTDSALLGLLNPEGFSQVLRTNLFALDLFHDSTGEPAPFAIMESLSHHPPYNINKKRGRRTKCRDVYMYTFVSREALYKPSSVLSNRFNTSAISMESSSGSWDEYD